MLWHGDGGRDGVRPSPTDGRPASQTDDRPQVQTPPDWVHIARRHRAIDPDGALGGWTHFAKRVAHQHVCECGWTRLPIEGDTV